MAIYAWLLFFIFFYSSYNETYILYNERRKEMAKDKKKSLMDWCEEHSTEILFTIVGAAGIAVGYTVGAYVTDLKDLTTIKRVLPYVMSKCGFYGAEEMLDVILETAPEEGRKAILDNREGIICECASRFFSLEPIAESIKVCK